MDIYISTAGIGANPLASSAEPSPITPMSDNSTTPLKSDVETTLARKETESGMSDPQSHGEGKVMATMSWW